MIRHVFEFQTATVTHLGKVRKINEDSIYANPRRGIWLVADGMGGHRDGNIASAMISEAAAKLAEEGDAVSSLVERLGQVNHSLLERSNGSRELIVGSTINALIIEGQRYTCIWAGDSRCYLIRRGALSQISQDHTEVQELVSSGAISPEEAKTWPRRNVITRAVGVDPELDLEAIKGVVEADDFFVLCSDGLTGHVSDAEILASTTWSTPKASCDRLLELALERGGKDNISIIVIHVANLETTRIPGADRNALP